MKKQEKEKACNGFQKGRDEMALSNLVSDGLYI